MDTTPLNPTPRSGPRVLSKIALIRLLIGLIQGLLLYFLFLSIKPWPNVWPGSNLYIFIPLLLICIIVPILLISSLGRLHRRPMVIWMLMAVIVLALLGMYDVWRGASASSLPLCLCLFPGFFIAHSLVLAGASDRKWIARYATYYEASSKLFVQVVFPFPFVCVVWLVLLVLLLGIGVIFLLLLINFDFLNDLLKKEWFFIPVTCVAFSWGMHRTDALPTTVRSFPFYLLLGILLILSLIVIIFLFFFLSLLWTGPASLWADKHATLVLLSFIITLIALISATVQGVISNHKIPRLIRLYVYVATLALLLLSTLAIYALQLLVSSYGWTSDHIFEAALVFVATCFAIGYAMAACRRDWPVWMAQVNVVVSFIIVGVLLALASPILDPVRLSVNNQMARLADGRTKADGFDFDYLKFEGGRFGLAALNELKTYSQGPDAATIREKAEIALNKKSRWEHKISR